MGVEQTYIPAIPITVPSAKLLKIALEKEKYFPGDEIKGEIWFEPSQQLIISEIIVRLHLYEGWTFQETSERSQTDATSVVLTKLSMMMGQIMNIPTTLVSFSPGQYHFPFTIQTPKELQPSFEFPMPNRRGFIRYSISAETVSPYIKTTEENPIIMKARPLVLNTPLFCSSCANVKKWGLFGKGTTILTATYPTNNYRIGDIVPLTVNVDNARGEMTVNSIKVKVIRKITFLKQNDTTKLPIEKTIYNQSFNANVPPRMKDSQHYSICIRDGDLAVYNYNSVLNPYPFEKDLNQLMPSVDGVIVKCEYSVKATAYFNSFVSYDHRPRVILPLSITHQLIEDYKLEKQEDEDLKKAIYQSQIEEVKEDKRNNEYIDKLISEDQDNKIYNSCIQGQQNYGINNSKDDLINDVPMSMSVLDDRSEYHQNPVPNNNGLPGNLQSLNFGNIQNNTNEELNLIPKDNQEDIHQPISNHNIGEFSIFTRGEDSNEVPQNPIQNEYPVYPPKSNEYIPQNVPQNIPQNIPHQEPIKNSGQFVDINQI